MFCALRYNFVDDPSVAIIFIVWVTNWPLLDSNFRSMVQKEGISRKDIGVLTCSASNLNGKSSAQIKVNVVGKPSMPEDRLLVSNVHRWRFTCIVWSFIQGKLLIGCWKLLTQRSFCNNTQYKTLHTMCNGMKNHASGASSCVPFLKSLVPLKKCERKSTKISF